MPLVARRTFSRNARIDDSGRLQTFDSIEAIQSNENRAMIGPRASFRCWPRRAAMRHRLHSFVLGCQSDNFHALDVLPTIHKRTFHTGSAHGGVRFYDGICSRDEGCMSRRDFVRLGLATLIATGAGRLRPAFARTLATGQGPGALPHQTLASEPKAIAGAADFMLRIAPMIVELAPHVAISTVGYGDKIPGPLLRVRE